MLTSPTALPLASVPTPIRADLSMEVEYGSSEISLMLSNIHNVDASAPPYELPSYEEVMAGTDPVVEQWSVSDLPHYFLSWKGPVSEKDKLIGQWEEKKWSRLADSLKCSSEDPIIAASGMSAKMFEPAMRAMATWVDMVKTSSFSMSQDDAHWRHMDSALNGALNELDMLRNACLGYSERTKPTKPSSSERFEGLAGEIDEFIREMRLVNNIKNSRVSERLNEIRVMEVNQITHGLAFESLQTILR